MPTPSENGGRATPRRLPPFCVSARSNTRLLATAAALLLAPRAGAQDVPEDSLAAVRRDSLRRADSLDVARRAAIRPPDTVRARPTGGVYQRQRRARPDSLRGWTTRDLVASLHVAQAAYRDWTQGGQNTLAGTARLDGRFEHMGRRWDRLYTFRFGYGVVRLDTLAARKAEDEVRLEATWRYLAPSGFGRLQPTAAVRLRTQHAPGFAYTRNPFRDGRPLPVKVSDAFAPAELSQSLGLTYERGAWFRQRAGVGLRQTVVTLRPYRILYGLDDDQLVRFDAGFEARTDVDRSLMENVSLRSSLSLFAPVVPMRRPDALWENRLTLRVNRWLQASAEAVALYDVTRSEKVQLREAFSLGLTMRVL